MGFQQLFIMGLVVVLSTYGGASEKQKLKKSAHMEKSGHQPAIACQDCPSFNLSANIDIVVSHMGELLQVISNLVKTTAEDVFAYFRHENGVRKIIESIRAQLPTVLIKCKNSLKSSIPCPQVDVLFDKGNMHAQNLLANLLKFYPALVAATDSQVAVVELRKALEDLEPDITNMLYDYLKHLLEVLGICRGLERKTDVIIALAPKLIQAVVNLFSQASRLGGTTVSSEQEGLGGSSEFMQGILEAIRLAGGYNVTTVKHQDAN